MSVMHYSFDSTQSALLAFHDKIKWDRVADHPQLPQRIAEMLHLLETYFLLNQLPSFRCVQQGSHAIGTGIRPIANECCNVDIALVFELSILQYSPREIKEWVCTALQGTPYEKATWRDDQLLEFHFNKCCQMNVRCFAASSLNSGRSYMAIADKDVPLESGGTWIVSNPWGVPQLLDNTCSNPHNLAQFQRVMRYMKRWRDLHFKAKGNARPGGLALTAFALRSFEVCKKDGQFDDLEAWGVLVEKMLDSFHTGRLSVVSPMDVRQDLLAVMNDQQMKRFFVGLNSLNRMLQKAHRTKDLEQLAAAMIQH